MLRSVAKRNGSHILPALRTCLVPGDGQCLSGLSQVNAEPSGSAASRQEVLSSLRKKLAEGTGWIIRKVLFCLCVGLV